MQQPRPPLEADLGAVQLQPHLAHGPRRRHPDPAPHGPPHHARDGRTGRWRRESGRRRRGHRGGVAVIAELGLAGVVDAAAAIAGGEGEVDAAAGAAHGLEAAPEISQSQRGEFISSFDTFSSAVSECNSYFMHLFIRLNWDREICSGRRVNFCVAQISDTMAPKTTTYRIPATAELSMRDCVKSPSQAAGGAGLTQPLTDKYALQSMYVYVSMFYVVKCD